MEDAHRMELLKSAHHRDHNLPDLSLFDVRLVLLVSAYLLIEIPIVGEFHHDAKVLILVGECLFVRHDIGVRDRGQDPNFV